MEQESTITLAERFGVKPFSVSRTLKLLGIEVRSEKRCARDLQRIALGKQRAGHLSEHERALMDALHRLGLRPVPQFAIDRFNVDLTGAGAQDDELSV